MGINMSLLEMSFSGALLILIIILVRAIFINKLPKRTFLVLWGIALLRLLVPFSIPSAMSVYSFIPYNISVEEMMASPSLEMPVLTMPALEGQPLGDNPLTQTPQEDESVSGWILIWAVGGTACIVYFISVYLYWQFYFRTSLPVSNMFVMEWLKEHSLKRSLEVRQSDRITAPLSFGIFHPTILVPRGMDWENKQQLQYIFLHEYVHICRYDVIRKLIAALALCVHWFNPMVWIMVLLFNRDIELACDECVIRKLGGSSKSAYALTLIGMEEKNSGLLPICNNFSKNAIEERITAIMKMKKTSLAAVIAAVLLITSVTIVFATSEATDDNQDSLMPVVGFSEEDYEKLLALQFDGYEEMSVSEYQMRVWTLTDTAEYREVLEHFSQNEKFYEMRDSNETASFLYYVLEPLTAQKWQSREFSGCVATHYETSDNAVLEYIITLEILKADELTVQEYSITRQSVAKDLNDIINNQTTYELRDEALMQELIGEEISNIVSMWGTDRLKVAIEYSFMPLGEIPLEDMESWEKERAREMDKMLEPYVPFGLSYYYDFDTDTYRMFFQGKEARGIYDEEENLWITEHSGIGEEIYDKNAVELYAVYENGELTGLREGTAQEQEEWSRQRRQTTDEWKDTQKTEEYVYATEEDYRSLLSLKTSDYRNRSLADFNMDLLEWANEDYERMERINTYPAWKDDRISLDDEELSFITLTVNLSGAENGKYVQSNYTGRAEEEPVYNQYLPEKEAKESGMAAWCSLWYQFSYSIADKNVLTVGERDDCVEGMISGIEKFWKETDVEEMLKMTETDIVKALQRIAEENSSSQIIISIDEGQVQFEKMDERNIR